jgi:hypothetical protein
VYNRSDKNISIPTIQLGKGLESKYRIMVDGMQGENGKIFHNVEMLANDSLYVFIETTASVADANPTDFLYTDQIQFGSASDLQTVELVTLIQDAIFLYPQPDEFLTIGDDQEKGFFLEDNELHFTSEKPYVIYGLAAVGAGKTLIIDPGARLHFHDSSGIIVADGGTINVNGEVSSNPETMEGEVIFEGDRLEPDFSDIPGQWFSIWLTPGSTGSFNHATIKNSVLGLYIQATAGVIPIKNTQIYNCSNFGILAQTANLVGENVVINTVGQATLSCSLGGSYSFTHSTFNNNSQGSGQSAVTLNNYYFDDQEVEHIYTLSQATFTNCIIYGSNQAELFLQKSENSAASDFNYFFDHCLIRLNTFNNGLSNNPLYDTDNTAIFNSCFIAPDSFTFRPHFWDVNNNKLNIDLESEAIGKANEAGTVQVPNDILNVVRTVPSDLGAYQAFAAPVAD